MAFANISGQPEPDCCFCRVENRSISIASRLPLSAIRAIVPKSSADAGPELNVASLVGKIQHNRAFREYPIDMCLEAVVKHDIARFHPKTTTIPGLFVAALKYKCSIGSLMSVPTEMRRLN